MSTIFKDGVDPDEDGDGVILEVSDSRLSQLRLGVDYKILERELWYEDRRVALVLNRRILKDETVHRHNSADKFDDVRTMDREERTYGVQGNPLRTVLRPNERVWETMQARRDRSAKSHKRASGRRRDDRSVSPGPSFRVLGLPCAYHEPDVDFKHRGLVRIGLDTATGKIYKAFGLTWNDSVVIAAVDHMCIQMHSVLKEVDIIHFENDRSHHELADRATQMTFPSEFVDEVRMAASEFPKEWVPYAVFLLLRSLRTDAKKRISKNRGSSDKLNGRSSRFHGLTQTKSFKERPQQQNIYRTANPSHVHQRGESHIKSTATENRKPDRDTTGEAGGTIKFVCKPVKSRKPKSSQSQKAGYTVSTPSDPHRVVVKRSKPAPFIPGSHLTYDGYMFNHLLRAYPGGYGEQAFFNGIMNMDPFGVQAKEAEVRSMVAARLRELLNKKWFIKNQDHGGEATYVLPAWLKKAGKLPE